MKDFFGIKALKVIHSSIEGERTVLDIDEINIEQGSTFGLVGESGAGKTVLAQTILGLLPKPPGKIISGEVRLNGRDLLKLKEAEMRKIRGAKIAMIFQDPMSSLNPVYTVGVQLVNVIMKNQKLSRKEAESRALKMIESVQLPDAESIVTKYPHQLSGGQRQRIIIALALSCGAEFLIADEPTRNLDVTIQAGIMKLLKNIQKELGITILFIANNLGLISAICDEVGILYKGKIIERGRVDEMLRNPSHKYTESLIQAVTPDESRDEYIGDDRPPILEVKALKKYFDVKLPGFKGQATVKAVDGVNLTIRKGETLGIVGESGCGKSTLVNTLLLLHEATEGEVVFDKEKLFDLNKKELGMARKNIQIVFQDPFWSLNPRMLVKDIIGEPLRVHCNLSEQEYMETIIDLLEKVEMTESDAYKYPHEFSGGQRQRIAIARTLSVKPKLIVLDEPTSSIDVMSQSRILELLANLRGELDLTYIIISHDLSVVSHLSDNIIVMYLGKIVERGRASDIFKKPSHPYTKALFNAIPKLGENAELTVLKGRVPSAIKIPSGCRFHPRCKDAMDICRDIEPGESIIENTRVTCHLYGST